VRAEFITSQDGASRFVICIEGETPAERILLDAVTTGKLRASFGGGGSTFLEGLVAEERIYIGLEWVK
jgi:hypothetical protein